MEERLSPDEKIVLDILGQLKIKWERFGHPPVFTLEESARFWQNHGGAHCKNLFIRNYRGNHHYLVIVRGDKKVDLRRLTGQLEEDRLSFASPERLKRFLGLSPGAVSPFGLINDRQKAVVVVVDRDLMDESELNFHPNVNTATIKISKDDFLRFLEWSGQKVIYLEMKTET